MYVTSPVPSDFGLASTPHLKISNPFPTAVPLSGQWAERGPAEPGHCPQPPPSSRPGYFSHPFYRLVPLLPHISLLGCAYSSSCGVKNTSLPLIIHLSRSRQDFDLNGKAFLGIWLHETHAKRAPHHQGLSLLGKF